MEFEAEAFMENPSFEEFEKLRKQELLVLGQHLALAVKQSMKKDEVRNVIIKALVDKGKFQPDVLDKILERHSAREGDIVKLQQLEHEFRLKQLEMEFKSREMEMKMQIEKELKLKAMEMGNVSDRVTPLLSTENNFDVTKHIRLVPQFQEREVDGYFQHFEKIAASLKWPKEVWTLLLQSVLIGRAREAFSALPLEQSSDYDLVKDAILKSYELVPEAYRQRFRNIRKLNDQTHVEFAREKERLFDRWLSSKGIDKSFDKLRQLMLIEEFKQCVHTDIKTHLDEHKVDVVHEVAIMADDYALTHKLNYVKSNPTKSNYRSPYYSKSHEEKARSDSSEKRKASDSNSSEKSKERMFKTVPTCAYCKKKGHLISECWFLQKKEKNAKSYPIACTVAEGRNRQLKPLRVEGREMEKSMSQNVMEEFKPFIFEGAMSKVSKETINEDMPINEKGRDLEIGLEDTFLSRLNDGCHFPLNTGYKASNQADVPLLGDKQVKEEPLSRDRLIREQERDPELIELSKRSISLKEVDTVPVCYYKKDGLLMRKWRPPDALVSDEWRIVNQIVVPKLYRRDILSLAHDSLMSGHLGVNKTYNKILNHFYWPKLRQDVAKYCRSCHACQVVGKPNQKIPVAPLKPIPAFSEAFSRVLIDCVGPLPKTKSGNEYLLTIMCASTRFPEDIPLRSINAQRIVKALTKFFTLVGLPKSVQSDQGSNFMSNLFQQVLHQLGIEQYKSSAYHPESQGALERFHQTLKNMIRTYCFENEKDWDEGVHLVLFAARETVQESLGFSPFELVFGHSVRGPLKLLQEKWLCEESEINLLDYVSGFKERLTRACDVARENLKGSQMKMKKWYDKDARNRVFKPGDRVLVLFPIPGHPLQARYYGPYEIKSKINGVNYIVKTPGRRKESQLCHINMLKEYVERDENSKSKSVSSTVTTQLSDHNDDEEDSQSEGQGVDCDFKLKNSDILADLDTKLSHLSRERSEELKNLILEFKHLFSDVSEKTDKICHDVDVGNATPVKQHPYRMNPMKLEHLRNEVKYMLDNDIIEPSYSAWSSPCVLVPKPGNCYRFCTDYRRVNTLSKTDSYPLPRIDDCIDKIGNAKFVSKFDLLKGYWQIPLTDRAREVSAFVTPDGLYEYKVMPFGMKNAPATFQRLINRVIANLEGCGGFVDDVSVHSDTWQQHLQRLRKFFERLSEAKLTVNLAKSEFCHATVTYLGHIVGQGQTRPVHAKVEGIVNFPVPRNKKELMRFLGMVGYYRRYCPNFAIIANSLTSLLKKDSKFVWSESCQDAFVKIKAILTSSPVLAAPDFSNQF
ncbi:uncharacterized protein LOC144433347 [Glandiceps talaboti]